MPAYKSNKFCVENDSAFQQFCGRWGLEFVPSFSPDNRVSFRGSLPDPIDDAFWLELAKHVQKRWTVITMENDLTLVGFDVYVHLVSAKGEHDFFLQTSLRFKDSVSEKKRRKYLGLPEPVTAPKSDSKSTSKSESNIQVRNRPYRTVEAKKNKN